MSKRKEQFITFRIVDLVKLNYLQSHYKRNRSDVLRQIIDAAYSQAVKESAPVIKLAQRKGGNEKSQS